MGLPEACQTELAHVYRALQIAKNMWKVMLEISGCWKPSLHPEHKFAASLIRLKKLYLKWLRRHLDADPGPCWQFSKENCG